MPEFGTGGRKGKLGSSNVDLQVGIDEEEGSEDSSNLGEVLAGQKMPLQPSGS